MNLALNSSLLPRLTLFIEICHKNFTFTWLQRKGAKTFYSFCIYFTKLKASIDTWKNNFSWTTADCVVYENFQALIKLHGQKTNTSQSYSGSVDAMEFI
jgi:hypothetical protein